MKLHVLVILLSLIVAKPISAQNQISLLQAEAVGEYLALSEEQSKAINPIIDRIKEILDEDKKIIADLKKRVLSGDEPGLFEKIRTKRGRDSRASAIEDLIEKVEAQLDSHQKTKFKNIEKPELKPLQKKEVFGE